MKQLTEDQVRQKLHLKPVHEHLIDIEQADYPFARATGKTTEMMIRAISALTRNEEVVVIAHDHKFADHLKYTIRRYCMMLNVDKSKLQVIGASQAYMTLAGRHNVLVYIDRFATGILINNTWMYPQRFKLHF